MPNLIEGKNTIDNGDDLVVLLIGARINRWWLLPLSLPILSKMGRMLEELQADPNSGLLGVQPLGFGGMVQYWKSLDHLLDYADARERTHKPTAKRYYQKLFKNQAVGIWHEAYFVRAGHYEGLYSNMPAFGLTQFRPLLPVTGEYATARRRLRAALESEPDSGRVAAE